MAVKIDVEAWRAQSGMEQLLEALGAADGLTRYVGGAVRDRLLGLTVSDIDLATRLDPEAVQQRLAAAGIKAVPTGVEHGTITAISDGHPVEVTTLRRDVATDGRRATVAFTDDWRKDAARRDFTLNALFADPISGEVFDYHDGLDDLAARRVRFIGDPLKRIAEDHLRILRFFRFHGRFGTDELDHDAVQACAARANDLMALSRERIADELLKLLALPNPGPTVRTMLERDILRPVLPEIEEQALPRLEQLIGAEVDTGIAPDALRRLSALLPRDPMLVDKVAARLKLSNRARKRLACAADVKQTADPHERAYRVGVESAVDTLLLDNRGSEAAAVDNWVPPRLPIGGGELIDLGVARGPEVARKLRQVEDAWIAAGFPEGEAFGALVVQTLKDAR